MNLPPAAGLLLLAARSHPRDDTWQGSSMAAEEPAAKKAKPSPLAVGDKMPAVSVDFGFGDTQVQINMADRCAGKKILVLGLPGAFTPC